MTRITTHPGIILFEEFLKPLKMSARGLSKIIDVPANRLTEIIRGKRSLTAPTALRLGKAFGTTPGFWMNLQINHDLSKVAMKEAKNLKKIKMIEMAAA
tara:strand:+ start:1205 stop:1501 length:297 start_codon:yes stop_codon:yes gene_type:complete